MHLLNELKDWWHDVTWLELSGAITALLCVWLAAINNIWNWPVAIVSVILYMIFFHNGQLYADMGLQVYFLIMNVYGWYFWSQRQETEEKAPIILITFRQLVWSAIIVVLTTIGLGYMLVKLSSVLHYKPASFPYLDSFCAAVSLVAQFFMARKVLENWLIWFFVDVFYVGIYIAKGFDVTAIVYALYLILAAWGYYDWRKDYRQQKLQEAYS